MSVYRYFAVGEETTFGTPVPAVEYMDPESAEMDPSGDQAIIYEGISGLDRIAKPGAYFSEGSVTAPVDLDVFPWFFKWALGGVNTTGEGPYTHTFFPQQSPLMPSFTARVGKDIFEHIFSGVVVGSLELSLEDQLLLGTVEMLGGKDEKGTLADPVEFTQGPVYAFHEVNATIDGMDESAILETFTLTIETGADNEAGRTVGSRFPRRAYRGALVVEMEMNLAFDSTRHLEKFWGTPTGPTTGDLQEFPLTINVGPDIDIVIPRGIYTAMEQPVGGRERIEQTGTLRGLVTSDGTGPIQISVTNNKTAY